MENTKIEIATGSQNKNRFIYRVGGGGGGGGTGNRTKELSIRLYGFFKKIGRVIIFLLDNLERRSAEAAAVHNQIQESKEQNYYRHWRYYPRRW